MTSALSLWPIGRNQKKFSQNKQYDTVQNDLFACANLHLCMAWSIPIEQISALNPWDSNNYQLWEVRIMQTFLSSIIFSQTAQIERLQWIGVPIITGLVANPMSYPYLDVKIFGIKRR